MNRKRRVLVAGDLRSFFSVLQEVFLCPEGVWE